jgi:hypothetical protein
MASLMMRSMYRVLVARMDIIVTWKFYSAKCTGSYSAHTMYESIVAQGHLNCKQQIWFMLAVLFLLQRLIVV